MNGTSTASRAATASVDSATLQLIDWLTAKACRDGAFGATAPADSISPLAPGMTAQLVARLTPQMGSVIAKIGHNLDVLQQARYLEQLAADPELPEAVKRAFPAIYASSLDRPLTPGHPRYGYLMEDLSATHELLFAALLRCTDPQETAAVAIAVWTFLERMYSTTRCDARPDMRQVYVQPTEEYLTAAALLDPRLEPDRPIRLTRDGQPIELPSWGTIMDNVARTLDVHAPAGRTFAHGDLTGWNLMVPSNHDSGDIRMIDPRPGITDYAHDIGRLVMSLRYMHLADATDLQPPRLTVSGDVITIEYDVPPQPATAQAAESTIAARAASFGRSHDDDAIATRLKIATGVALLADLPQLESPNARRRQLALGAFAEGLLELHTPTRHQ